VSTYSAVTQTQGVSMLTTMGYRACMAVDNDWKCRTFDRADRSDTALQTTWATTLTTLGNEGWELVSVVQDPPATSANTYIFKRQRQ
jgi:hypothetical protein